MATLAQLAADLPTDKGTDHSYLEVYGELLKERRESTRHVLELGVYEGGSLALWERFFPGATVTGVDITTQKIRVRTDPERTRVVVANAYTKDTVNTLSDRQYDLIIDDGPHTLASMLFVASEYVNLLQKDGVLVIEDIQDAAWVELIKDAFPPEFRDRARVVDRRHVKGRYDDLVIVLDLR